jgi:hypothetical protein
MMSGYKIHLNPKSVATQEAAKIISGVTKYATITPTKTKELRPWSANERNKPEIPTDSAPKQKPIRKPANAEMMQIKMLACSPLAMTPATIAHTKGIKTEIFAA